MNEMSIQEEIIELQMNIERLQNQVAKQGRTIEGILDICEKQVLSSIRLTNIVNEIKGIK